LAPKHTLSLSTLSLVPHRLKKSNSTGLRAAISVLEANSGRFGVFDKEERRGKTSPEKHLDPVSRTRVFGLYRKVRIM
jgi:hypothetical protein